MTMVIVGEQRNAASSRFGETLQIETLSADRLPEIRAAWEDLYDRALEVNPFFGPDFLAPLAAHVVPAQRMRVLTIWRAGRSSSDLLGFMPLDVPRLPRPWPFGHISAFRHPLIVGSMPLIDREAALEVWSAILHWLGDKENVSPLLIDGVILDRAGIVALRQAAARDGWPIGEVSRYERAALVADCDFESYWAKSFDKRRRNALKRRQRLLEARGELRFGCAKTEVEFQAALEAFLRLEAKGWKGRQRTALAARPKTAAFAAEAFSFKASRPGLRIDTLALDGRVISAAITLLSRDGAASVKSAYDESEAAHSPGQILDLGMARSLLKEKWTSRLDSVAIPGHPLEGLWHHRVPVADIMIGLKPGMDSGDLEFHMNTLRNLRKGRKALKAALAWMSPRRRYSAPLAKKRSATV